MHLLLLGSFAPSLLNFRGPLIREALARGHRVSVGAPEIGPALRAGLEALGAEVHDTPLRRTGMNPLADLAYKRALTALMRRIRPDRVLTYTIKPNIWGGFAAAAAGVPSAAMVTGLGYLFTEGEVSAGVKGRLLQAVAAGLYARATARNFKVIFQNPDDLADALGAGLLRDRSKAVIVDGSGVDLDHYARAPLPEGPPSFLMISRLLKSKGVRDYAMGALRLKARHPEAAVRLAGYFDEGPDGITRAELDGWIAGGLEYLGPLADVRPAIAAATVNVLPSWREGTPRSVLEAMAMGRAVITTDAPGCRETIVDGQSGFLVPLRNPDALAEAMARFVADPGLAARMGEAAFARAVAKYDVHKVNAAVLAAIGL